MERFVTFEFTAVNMALKVDNQTGPARAVEAYHWLAAAALAYDPVRSPPVDDCLPR